MKLFFLLWALLAAFSFCHEGHHASGPVQYCKDKEFCFAQTTYANPATGNHDLYITFLVNGFDDSAAGWSAVGLGTAMEGALMFVVYGNPKGEDDPVLSVRTTMERHNPPLPIIRDDSNGVEVQLVFAKWLQEGSGYSAKMNLICYNCTRWPGTTIDASAKEQPFIWAQNPSQEIKAHKADILLQIHPKDASGFGFFYVDMAMSTSESSSPPEFPEVDTQKSNVGAATESSDVSAATGARKSGFRHRAWQAHGFLLTVAFLILFPLGVLLLRRQSENSFKLHWIVQLTATLFILLGILLGVYLHPEIEHLHQVVGLGFGVAPIAQVVLGWRHHVKFTRTGRRTSLSVIHISLGRALMIIGAFNILLGMVLKHWSAFWVIVLAAIIIIEIAMLSVFLLRQEKRQKEQQYAQINDHEGAFALDDVESPISEEDEGSEKGT